VPPDTSRGLPPSAAWRVVVDLAGALEGMAEHTSSRLVLSAWAGFASARHGTGGPSRRPPRRPFTQRSLSIRLPSLTRPRGNPTAHAFCHFSALGERPHGRYCHGTFRQSAPNVRQARLAGQPVPGRRRPLPAAGHAVSATSGRPSALTTRPRELIERRVRSVRPAIRRYWCRGACSSGAHSVLTRLALACPPGRTTPR